VDNSFSAGIIQYCRRVGVIKVRSLGGLSEGMILRVFRGKEGDAGAAAPAHGAFPADQPQGLKVNEGAADLG